MNMQKLVRKKTELAHIPTNDLWSVYNNILCIVYQADEGTGQTEKSSKTCMSRNNNSDALEPYNRNGVLLNLLGGWNDNSLWKTDRRIQDQYDQTDWSKKRYVKMSDTIRLRRATTSPFQQRKNEFQTAWSLIFDILHRCDGSKTGQEFTESNLNYFQLRKFEHSLFSGGTFYIWEMTG